MEQLIAGFFTKSLDIILESRSPYVSSQNFNGEHIVSSPSSSSSSPSSVRSDDKCFNYLRVCPENLALFRQSNLEWMVVDVILIKRSDGFDQEEMGYDSKSEKIIERWVVQYESGRSRDCGTRNRRSSNILLTLHKKAILLLRSLYVTLRLLPAYKIFRDLNSSGHICSFNLSHRVSFVEPFTYKEETAMQRFRFTPLDISGGRLCLSVIYCSSLTDVSSRPSSPMSPQFIPDYVGSSLAEPVKRFPVLPHGSPPLKSTRVSTTESDKISQLFLLGEGDTKKYSGVKISSDSSPRIPFFRTSNWRFPDEPDDSEVLCPFALEDDDMIDLGSRPCSFAKKPHALYLPEPGGPFPTRKSQEAAIGALVLMLQKTLPLCQDFYSSVDLSQNSRCRISSGNLQEHNHIFEAPSVQQAVSLSIASSRLVSPKTVADAFEELQDYKKMKDKLFTQTSQ